MGLNIFFIGGNGCRGMIKCIGRVDVVCMMDIGLLWLDSGRVMQDGIIGRSPVIV